MAAFSRLVSLIISSVALTGLLLHAQDSVDGVAAVVNDKVITKSDVDALVDEKIHDLEANYQGEERRKHILDAKLEMLKVLIEKELIIQDFNKKQLFIPDNIVEDKIKEIIQEGYDGDRTAFTRTLQSNGESLEQFKREQKDQLIVQAMRYHYINGSVIISPFKVETYYQENSREFTVEEQIKISMIVLNKAPYLEKRKNAKGEEEDYDPEEALADEILFKLDSGADFAELARAYSEGKNREKGGDWGWISKKDLRQEIVDAVSALQPGQISRVIKTADQFYIVRLDDIKRGRIQPMSEVRAEIEGILTRQQKHQLETDWLDGLKAKAYIKTF